MEDGMDQVHRQIFEKIAQDSGAPEGAGPGFVTGLNPQEEWLIRKRTEAAAKLRHLPPELAYALTGEMPITDSPAANIELQRALERASSRGRSKLVGLGYGLPAAAAGAVLGHLLSGGDPRAAAAGGAVAGGGIGYMAHRGEREGQRRLGGQLAGLRTQYQMAQQQALAQQQEAMQELAQAEAMKARGRGKGQRKAAQANFNDAMMARFKRQSKKGLPKMGGLMSGSLDDKPHFDASDPGRHYKPGLPWPAEVDREAVNAEAPTYMGGDKRSALEAQLRGQVSTMLAQVRAMEKASQGEGTMTSYHRAGPEVAERARETGTNLAQILGTMGESVNLLQDAATPPPPTLARDLGQVNTHGEGALNDALKTNSAGGNAPMGDFLARLGALEKASAGIGGTGNQVGMTGVGAMKAPSPSGGGMGTAAQAPRVTASPSSTGLAPSQPPGLSGQTTAIKSQPKPKIQNLGPGNNLASGAPPAVSTPPAHVASAMPNAGAGAALPGGVTAM